MGRDSSLATRRGWGRWQQRLVIAGNVAATRSAASPPRDMPSTATRSASTAGCARSQSMAFSKYSSGICEKLRGRPSIAKYARHIVTNPDAASGSPNMFAVAMPPSDPLRTITAGRRPLSRGRWSVATRPPSITFMTWLMSPGTLSSREVGWRGRPARRSRAVRSPACCWRDPRSPLRR